MTALNEVYAQVRMTGEITAPEALRVRRALYALDRDLTFEDLETMLRIDDAVDRSDHEWDALLVEVAVDRLIHQSEPIDVLDVERAGWLVDRIAVDGRVKTARQFELMIRVLEASRSAPEPFVALALKQVKAAVVDGDGPLAGVRDVDPGRITAVEAELVRRILYAGGTGAPAITRSEAEVIFDINDAVSSGNNDPHWTDLFVKAIANCVMTASGYTAPPREISLAAEDLNEVAERQRGTGFFADFAVQGLRGILDLYAPPKVSHWTKSAHADADAGDHVAVDRSHAVWLAHRISRDGNIDDNERALLRFIRDEAGSVHPALRDLIARAA